MKIPLVVTLVGSAMSLSVPTLAQQQKAIDPEVRKQVEAVFTRFVDAYNKHDAAALAALYSPDAVELRSWRGLLSGEEAIRRMYEFDFASSGGKMTSQVVQLCGVGSAICEIAHSKVGEWKNQSMTIYALEDDAWKACMVYVDYTEEKNAIDPEVRQQIEAMVMKFDDAYNKHDRDAMAVLHSQDAVEVRSWGGANYLRTGRQAIATQYANDFISHPQLVTRIAETYPIGSDICAIMDLTVGMLKGHAAKIFIRDADTWKIGMAYLTRSSGS